MLKTRDELVATLTQAIVDHPELNEYLEAWFRNREPELQAIIDDDPESKLGEEANEQKMAQTTSVIQGLLGQVISELFHFDSHDPADWVPGADNRPQQN